MAESTSMASIIGVLVIIFSHLLQPVIEGSREGREKMFPAPCHVIAR